MTSDHAAAYSADQPAHQPPLRAATSETSDYQPNGVLVTEHEAVPDRDNPRDNYECAADGEPWPCEAVRATAPRSATPDRVCEECQRAQHDSCHWDGCVCK